MTDSMMRIARAVVRLGLAANAEGPAGLPNPGKGARRRGRNVLRPALEQCELRLLLATAADGVATTGVSSVPANNTWQTVCALTVNVDAAKAGLYDLHFDDAVYMAPNSYASFQVVVDGAVPADGAPAYVDAYGSNSNSYRPVSMSRELNLTPGVHQVQVQMYGNSNYSSTFYNYDPHLELIGYNRLKAVPTVNVAGTSRAYDGNPDPATGSVIGEQGAYLGTPAFTYTDSNHVTTGTPPTDAGTYTVTATFAGNADYFAASNTAQFTISARTTSFDSLVSPTMTYGDASATLGGHIAALGMTPPGNVAVTLNGVTQQAAIDPATGNFSSTFNTAALSASATPYTIGYAYAGTTDFSPVSGSGSLTVGKAHLTARADDQTKLTGAALPLLTYHLSGFVNNEDPTSAGVTGAATTSTTATASSPANTYTIALDLGTLSAANYDFTAAAGTLTITARPLTVGSQATVAAFQGTTTGTVVLATFGDANASSAPTTYTATIDWQDGSALDTGAVAVSGTSITVSGAHTYGSGGAMHPIVTLADAGGSTASTTATVNVASDVSAQISTSRSGLTYNRSTGLFYGSITLTNTGTTTLAGTIQLVLAGLTPGVTLVNGSGFTPGASPSPYINANVTQLAAGQSITIQLVFRKPTLATLVDYTPKTFVSNA